MSNDTLGGVEMTEDEAFATVQKLEDQAMPRTIPRIANLITAGRNAGKTDIQIATEIAEFIFAGEPRRAE